MNSAEPLTNISNEPVVMFLLRGGFEATEKFYNEIKLQAEEVLPVLVSGVSYELKTLCGAEFWNLLSKNEQTLAGRCMVRMVKTGQLPLDFVGCKHASPKKYILKQS